MVPSITLTNQLTCLSLFSTMLPTMFFLLLAVSLSLSVVRATAQPAGQPIQQRIALNAGGMTLSWSTVGPLSTAPAVRYGLSPSPTHMTTHVTGESLHYAASTTYFHHVILASLQPSTTYYWSVTTPALANATVLSFTTAPKVGDSRPFTIAINGDMGLVNEDNTVAALTAWTDRINLFWHIGDLNYADDSFLYLMTYESATETWMNRMTPIYSQRPYMICPGNHDITCNEELPFLCPDSQRNVTSYLQRYRMPYGGSGAVNNMYFSFDYGLVHFISIDTEVNIAPGPEGPGTYINAGPFPGNQLAWLEADLKKAAANRATVPWIIVAGHRPYYTSNSDNILAAARPLFEPLFVKYGVDVVYFGHVHWYERMYPTNNGTVTQTNYSEPTAPVYFISASAGNVEGLDTGKATQPYTAFLDDKHFGFGLLNVQNATHLNWTFYESKTRQLLDTVEITKVQRWEKLHS